ncbi:MULTISPECIES: SCO6880 family protein [unclassified Streptomyces]|uniref:SCO6880 family protein n=1 Tax=unclassified Streptomyces TaxID=2593676 RepID=UPI002DD90386|nr:MULTISPECIES: SCO6880 family protein [unclassified Streptomyces]WSA94682.1 type VII secretion protein EccE [Streptomyces sp. NBC_01795]WSS12698.1 type VII secretion protein EccE [Streptomyces sp. NBC_01186]WSS41481.1 type VII secretion protein EccE [Streptomyces sp. NBC_01187]
MPVPEPVTYGGWQSERSGFMGNLSGPGFALVAASTVIGLIPLYQRSWSATIVSLPLALLLLALAFGRVLGLSADQWIILAVRHQIAVATKKNLFLSGAFAPRTKTGEQPMDLPGVLARLRILNAPDGLGGELGVVHDPVDSTYTAIARIGFPGLALIDTDKQNTRVGAWAAFLRSQCKEDGAITRIAVHQRSLPDDGTELRSWTDRHITSDAPPAAIQALDELMVGAGPVATIRETYLSLTFSSARARLAVRAAGGGQIGAAAVLVREIHAMQGALSSAGLQVEEMLTPRKVAQAIRTAYDPESQLMLAARNNAAQESTWEGAPPGLDPAVAGPAAAETSWGVYRHDGAWTVSYQVRGLPQSEVYATFLQPLLRPRRNARRSLSLVYEPIGPVKARQELAREKAKRDAARQLRSKTGRTESEDERRESMTARAQDVARAAGHGVLRLSCLLAVTVMDEDELEIACAELQADASAAGLEIRRVWGAQDAGFAAAALPLGHGLPDRRVGV